MPISGPFSILSLIEGWDYREYLIDIDITKKITPIHEIKTPGWLLSLPLITDDAYATLRITYKGPGEHEITANINAEAALIAGIFQQDPGGYIPRYFRPNPNSTAGLYVISAYNGGLQGFPQPYIPPITVQGYLGALSTQESATLAGSVEVVEFRDVKHFKQSLKTFYKELLGPKVI